MTFPRILQNVLVASLSVMFAVTTDTGALTPRAFSGASGGAWEVASNWIPEGVPTLADAVYITNAVIMVKGEAVAGSIELAGGTLVVAGATTTVLSQTPRDDARIDPVGLEVAGNFLLAGDCSIGGLNQICESYLTVGGDLHLEEGARLAVYAGEQTEEIFSRGGAQVAVGGTTTLDHGAWIYPDCAPFSGAPVVFDLQTLIVSAGAGFDASARGWGYRNLGPNAPPVGILYEMVGTDHYGTRAPGAGTSYDRGGGYGGQGGNASTTRGLAYGYQYAPFMPGSPNGIYNGFPANHRRGGGAVRIQADQIALDGALHADAGFQGNGDTSYGGASGGGIWVLCNAIDFGPEAHLSVAGGDIKPYSSGGGGGRVSISVGLSAADKGALQVGEEPPALQYQPLTQVSCNIRGGQASGLYAPSGTATLVQAPAADRFLQITGNPLSAGAPAAGYGTQRYVLGSVATQAVPLTAWDPTSDDDARYTCAGYTVSNGTQLVASGTTNWVSLTMNENLILTWQWNNRELRYRAAAGANGRIVMGGPTNTVFEQWEPAGSSTALSVEAIPDPGYRFLCWEGDLVMGETFKRNLTMPVSVRGANVTARFAPLVPSLTDKIYTGDNNGFWEVAGNWSPAGAPTAANAVFITNRTVYVESVAEAGSLVLSEAALIVAGSTATVTAQKPRDAARLAPVGLFVQGNLWLAGNCSVGGTEQACNSYLTVGGDLTLAGSSRALAVYAGPRRGRHPFINGGARVTVAGQTKVETGSWIYPDCDIYTGHPVVFDLQDLTLETDAGIDATQRGWGYVNIGLRLPAAPDYYERAIPSYWGTTALGRGLDYSIGAGHGGRGGKYRAADERGSTYGNVYAPLFPGSPNGMYIADGNNPTPTMAKRGGGVVRILARTTLLDGSLKANAGEQSNYGGSSGGAIWLTTARIDYGEQAGMSATGGRSNYNSAGGGGRVAVGLGLDSADMEELAAGRIPPELLIEAVDLLPADVTGGAGSSAYAEAGSLALVVNPMADKKLIVKGAPLELGTASPPYGTSFFPHGTRVTSTVGLLELDPTTANRERYYCQGYTLANRVGVFATGISNQAEVELVEDLTLTWLWGGDEVLYEGSAGAHGTIRRGAMEGAFQEWIVRGTAAPVVEAVPDVGYEFLYWLGDVPYGMATNNPLSFASDVPRRVQALFRKAEPATTRVWNGGTGALGSWYDAANWLPANIPGRDDHVVIPSGYCATTNYAECGSLTVDNAAILRVASLTTLANRAGRVESSKQLAIPDVNFDEGRLVVRRDVELNQNGQLGVGGDGQRYAAALEVGGNLTLNGTAALAIYGGPTNQMINFATGTASVRIGGLLKVNPGCWIYPISERYTGGSPRFDTHSIVVEVGGGFNATASGFDRVSGRIPVTLAPGLGDSFNRGAGYGGMGGYGNLGTFGQLYGFINAPIHPGSCSGEYKEGTHRRGGGLIRLHVADWARLAGSLIADGSQTSFYGGASGGGIWITAQRLRIESGCILQVRGGASNYTYSGGGGGRIALGIKLASADIEQMALTGEPLSRVVVQDADEFLLRYPGTILDVAPVKIDTGTPARSAQPGTFILLDATPSGSMLLLR